jgi:hypothetical protein
MRPTFLPSAVLRPATWLSGLFLASVLAACSKPPPPAPPPEPTPEPEPVKEPEPPPPPPPPKCEALSEKCAAVGDTRARIGDKGPSVAPPKGWIYAQEKDRTVLVSPAGDAMIAFAPVADASPEKALEAIDATVKHLEITNVKIDSLKRRLKKAQATADVDGVKVAKWEVDKKVQLSKDEPMHKEKPGVVLVVQAPLPSQALVAVGFVTKADAKTPADAALVSAMNAAVDSLKGK